MSDTLSAIVSASARDRREPALYVGLAGDDIAATPARFSLGDVDVIEISRGAVRQAKRARVDGARVLALALVDPRLSSRHARISRLGTAWIAEDLASKNGTWVGRERIARRPLADGDVLLVGHTALVFRDRGGDAGDLESPAVTAPGLATLSPVLAQHFALIAAAARAAMPIEVIGETGTGKELAARAIHVLSGRSGKLVAVNCGALTDTLFAGELFGHERGAFTGADTARVGLVRSADRGTLFLDEVTELAARPQAALLRVLQENEVMAVGGDRAVRVDVRVVSASQQPLESYVDGGSFRADLRARLLGAKLELPPLRERPEDLAVIIGALLARLAAGRTVTFTADAVMALYAHRWPLNVRELERALSAALAVSDGRIEVSHLALRDAARPVDEPGDLRGVLAAAIARHGGNLAAVARELGKDRAQIRRWMKRFGITR